MKSILILRGVPGSGKTTWIKENSLEKFTISKDTIRSLIGSYDYDDNLNLRLSLDRVNRSKVDELFKSSIIERMSKGNFIVIDCCNLSGRNINEISDLALIFGYKVFLKSFSIPNNIFFILNERSKHSIFLDIPKKSIEELILKYLNFNLKTCTHGNKIVEIESLSDIGEYWTEIANIDYYVKVDQERMIHLIGDIHSDINNLSKIDFNDNDLYVFHGDYCDRGKYPVETLKFLIKLHKLNKGNIIFLEGNHELHLRRWVNGFPPVSKEFSNSTLSELNKESERFRKDLESFINDLKEFVVLRAGSMNDSIICCHAGLRNELIVTRRMNLLYQGVGTLISGTRDIDKQDRSFTKTSSGTILSHGHIAYSGNEKYKFGKVINLDTDVKTGGITEVIYNSETNSLQSINIHSDQNNP